MHIDIMYIILYYNIGYVIIYREGRCNLYVIMYLDLIFMLTSYLRHQFTSPHCGLLDGQVRQMFDWILKICNSNLFIYSELSRILHRINIKQCNHVRNDVLSCALSLQYSYTSLKLNVNKNANHIKMNFRICVILWVDS